MPPPGLDIVLEGLVAVITVVPLHHIKYRLVKNRKQYGTESNRSLLTAPGILPNPPHKFNFRRGYMQYLTISRAKRDSELTVSRKSVVFVVFKLSFSAAVGKAAI